MTTPRQPRRSLYNLPATDAEILAWVVSMVEADQYPSVVNYGPCYEDPAGTIIKYPGRNQMAPLGREYEHEKDAGRWWWMRDHQRAVEAWLIAKGLFAQLDKAHPSSAELIVRSQALVVKTPVALPGIAPKQPVRSRPAAQPGSPGA